jgi:hypothetical protein
MFCVGVALMRHFVAAMRRGSPVGSGFDMVMTEVRQVNVMSVKPVAGVPHMPHMSSVRRMAKVRSTCSLQKQRNQRGDKGQIENEVPPLEQVDG